MTRASTTPERLTRIETLLEQAVTQRNEDRTAMRETIDQMAKDITEIKADLAADKAALATLKDKGAGILIGVGLFGTGVGAAVLAALGKVMGWFE